MRGEVYLTHVKAPKTDKLTSSKDDDSNDIAMASRARSLTKELVALIALTAPDVLVIVSVITALSSLTRTHLKNLRYAHARGSQRAASARQIDFVPPCPQSAYCLRKRGRERCCTTSVCEEMILYCLRSSNTIIPYGETTWDKDAIV